MPRFPAIFAVLVATTLAGCMCPAWSTRPSVVYTPEVSSAESMPPPPPAAASESQQTQQVMDELKRLGAVDPEARDRLIEDLRQSDPAIWPLVVQQHRSTAAYRQQVEQKAATAQAQRLPPVMELAAAAPVERPNPLPERQPEPATPVLLPPPDAVVPASYVATAAAETSQTFKAALESTSEPPSRKPDRLEVRNVTFCTEVQSYGCIKPFENAEFRPNQEVLLYAELEHFVSEPTPKGYCTSLCSRYEVLDAKGRRVVEQKFSPTEEYCRNRRRDFFLGYRLRWPKDLAPGRYQLRLVIDDQKSHRSGEAVVQFDIQGDGGVKSAVAGG